MSNSYAASRAKRPLYPGTFLVWQLLRQVALSGRPCGEGIGRKGARELVESHPQKPYIADILHLHPSDRNAQFADFALCSHAPTPPADHLTLITQPWAPALQARAAP